MNKTKLVNCFLSGRRKSISKYENQTEELQSKVLQKLIRQAIHTEWGQTHGFAQGNAASTEETSAMAEELADMVHSSTETIQNLNVHVQNLIENVSKFKIQ